MCGAGRDPSQLERNPAVAVGLADGRGLERIERHAFEPPRIEHERGVLDSRWASIVKRDSKKSPLRSDCGE